MSRKAETRAQILRAARREIEEHGAHEFTLERAARAAGVSRQAVYLHFGSRSGVFVALAPFVDATERVEELGLPVREARTAEEALGALIRFQADYWPRVYGVARPFDEARRGDEAIAAAWDERMQRRLEGCRMVAGRLRDEGLLRETWSVDDAGDMLWALTSMRAWEDLVIDGGWTNEHYVERMIATARGALLEQADAAREDG